MKSHSDYFNAVTNCLMSFQHIEEALKMVLVRLESLTYFCLRQYTPYNLKPKFDAIQSAAMGRLIDMLTVYTDEKQLIAELRKIKKKRDQIAHRSLLMTVEEANDKESIHLKASELEGMKESSEAVLKELLEKWKDLDDLLNKITAEPVAKPDRPKSRPPG
ncbi:MAG: hypothetical protein ABIF87_00555 [Pseudomonadota bacterium]